jgi:ATP-dependent helicase/nuclease subunit B
VRLQKAARVFLAAESERTDREAVAFELGFGNEGDPHPPVEVRLSDDVHFQLVGRVDRVDRHADGYEIWDYKTGSAARFDDNNLLRRARHLQWALYALAVEEIRGDDVPVRESGYFFTSPREHGLRVSAPPPAREELRDMLEPLLGIVRAGVFPAFPGDGGCRYCDYNSICAAESCSTKKTRHALLETIPEGDSARTVLERWVNLK